MRAPFDALVSAETIGDKNVDLEHIAFAWRWSDCGFVRLPGEDQLAAVFSRPGSNCYCDRDLSLVDTA